MVTGHLVGSPRHLGETRGPPSAYGQVRRSPAASVSRGMMAAQPRGSRRPALRLRRCVPCRRDSPGQPAQGLNKLSPGCSAGCSGEVSGGVDDEVGVAGEVVDAECPGGRQGGDVGVGPDFVGGEVQVRGGRWGVRVVGVTVKKLLAVAEASVRLMTAAVGLPLISAGIPA